MSILRIATRVAVAGIAAAAVACGGGASTPAPQPSPARPATATAREPETHPEARPETRPETRPESRPEPSTTPAKRGSSSRAERRSGTAAAEGQAIAIVVNPHTAVSNVSFDELQRLFMGDQQFWHDRSKVTLLVRAPTARERSIVLERIYHMDEERFHEYWIGKMFRAEVAGGPKIVYSTDMALNLIEAIRGSITFVPATAVTKAVKVLRIDGKLPSDPGYPLR